mmetsp:Transcript_11979/g.33766  ORF Transcript_11979/g.33766 Transcript_11979/m.33766 type:complete len:103 (+) Transcript_11979:104-412(+)
MCKRVHVWRGKGQCVLCVGGGKLLNRSFGERRRFRRDWRYHMELKRWITRTTSEPLVKTNTYERGNYIIFDPEVWESVRKPDFLLMYDALEEMPTLPPQVSK